MNTVFILKYSNQIKIFILILQLFASYSHPQTTETRNNFKKYYDNFNVEGSFVLYDQSNDK
ncbi:MAG: hypothetical protein WBN42_14620, partial [Ignavibacteriaceae bacterium]